MIEMVTPEDIIILTDYYFNLYIKGEKKTEKEIADFLKTSDGKVKGFINYVTVQKDFIPSFGNLYNIIMLTTIFKPKSKNIKRQVVALNNSSNNEIVKIYKKKIGA